MNKLIIVLVVFATFTISDQDAFSVQFDNRSKNNRLELTKKLFKSDKITIDSKGIKKSIPCRIYMPDNISLKEPIPLLVFLHGAGERGNNNISQLNHFPTRWVHDGHLGKRHKAVVLAVQCEQASWWTPIKKNEKEEWVSNLNVGLTDSMRAVEKKIKELSSDSRIDKKRIYLTGLSMGGFGSWDLLRRHPDWFAAVAPICGGCNPKFAHDIVKSKVPIWTFHGESDRIVMPDRTRRIVNAIRKLGGSVAYTELPRVGHNSWDFAYGPNGMIEWMFGHRRIKDANIK